MNNLVSLSLICTLTLNYFAIQRCGNKERKANKHYQPQSKYNNWRRSKGQPVFSPEWQLILKLPTSALQKKKNTRNSSPTAAKSKPQVSHSFVTAILRPLSRFSQSSRLSHRSLLTRPLRCRHDRHSSQALPARSLVVIIIIIINIRKLSRSLTFARLSIVASSSSSLLARSRTLVLSFCQRNHHHLQLRHNNKQKKKTQVLIFNL